MAVLSEHDHEILARAILDTVREATASLAADVATIKAEIAALKAPPTAKAFDPVAQHNPGDVVTYEGATYRCTRSTRAVPTSSDAWVAA